MDIPSDTGHIIIRAPQACTSRWRTEIQTFKARLKNLLLCEMEDGDIIITEYSENRKGQTNIVKVSLSLD